MTEVRMRAREEGGWALVTAVTMLAIMMVVGMTAMGAADFNSGQTRIQRERESSLNLAEGVLLAQSFTLARQWPGTNRPAFPLECTSGASTSGQCPNRETLAAANSSNPTKAAFQGVDFAHDVSWTTRVRDNYGAMAASYSKAAADTALTGSAGTCAAPCSRDFNGDHAMWVQARTVVRGEVRNVVALMKLEQLSEAVPQAGLITGALKITNNGNKPMVDVSGSQVVVRCTLDVHLGNASICTNFRGGQIAPSPQQGSPGNLMDLSQINRFRDRAIIDGTYYTGCPPSLAGRVVFVENCQNPPNYGSTGATACTPPTGMSNVCLNTIQQPGVLIVRCGALRMVADWTYVGLVYFVNGSDGSCPGQARGSSPPTCTGNSLDNKSVLDAQGGFGVWGGLAADGNACVLLGSNGMQLRFDTRAFTAAQSYGTVGLVQNTWRELPTG
jgi:Tfp pilus assembly protein PilX